MADQTKQILLETSGRTRSIGEKRAAEPRKRVITSTPQWHIAVESSHGRDVFSAIQAMTTTTTTATNTQDPMHKMIRYFIQQKLHGYHCQDVAKHITVVADTAMTVDMVLQKLMDCCLLCFYCKQPVLVLYENVREPTQWTLERIDNQYGHVPSNVVIACLQCNLRRKTMYHERYLFTKELSIKKV